MADVPQFDLGNPILAATTALLTTSVAETPQGQRLMVTIRTASTTLTVLLSKADGIQWGKQISGDAALLSGAGLIVAGNGTRQSP